MTLHLLPVFVVRLGRQPLLRSVVFLFRPDLGKNDLPTRGCPLTYVPPYCLSSVFGQPSASRYRDRYSDDAGDDSDIEGVHVADQVNMEEMSLPGHLYAVVTFCHTQASVSSSRGVARASGKSILRWTNPWRTRPSPGALRLSTLGRHLVEQMPSYFIKQLSNAILIVHWFAIGSHDRF